VTGTTSADKLGFDYPAAISQEASRCHITADFAGNLLRLVTAESQAGLGRMQCGTLKSANLPDAVGDSDAEVVMEAVFCTPDTTAMALRITAKRKVTLADGCPRLGALGELAQVSMGETKVA